MLPRELQTLKPWNSDPSRRQDTPEGEVEAGVEKVYRTPSQQIRDLKKY